MDCLVIKGGTRLKGDVKISGAKNAALPLLAATLLTDQECVIRNLPNLSDVRFMCRILESLGADVTVGRGTVRVRAKKIEDSATTTSLERCAVPSVSSGR